MIYITNWNEKIMDGKLSVPNLTKITVKRLNGDFQIYYRVNLHSPSVHSVFNCERLKQALPIYDNLNNIIGYKPNSGTALRLNYPIKKVNETSYDEVDGIVDDFNQSIFYHLGFSQCTYCGFVESLNFVKPNDLLTSQEIGEQNEKDMENLAIFFKNNPQEYSKWLGLK